jgi:Trypsin-like peptidase domain
VSRRLLAPSQIAAALSTTRAEFSRLYLQAQPDDFAQNRYAFEAVSSKKDDLAAFEEALTFAQAKGFLDRFAGLVVAANLENGQVAAALADISARGNATLQALQGVVAKFEHPHIVWRGIADAMRWTCRIEVGNAITGTGFLVGADLVLTAWHVVKSLFDYVDGKYKHREEPQNLKFHFDDFLVMIAPGILGPTRSTVVEADDDWYVAHSCCHQVELNDELPADLAELTGYWDFCVVRLKSLPGLERRWAHLEPKAVVPHCDAPVVLFHHPTGQPMRASTSVLADFQNPAAGKLDVRFLHRGDALGGSSGGPCFDKNFSLFGIHQGVFLHGPAGSNRGVPITRIIEHIKNQGSGELPTPPVGKMPILRAGEEGYKLPVIGRDALQSLVFESISLGAPRLISVSGMPKTGKSFCMTIIDTMLPDGAHLKVRVDAQTVAKSNALEYAQEICERAGSVLQEDDTENDSTGAAYQKDFLVGKIIDALDDRRAGRLVWLIFDNMNALPIKERDTRDLLLSLFNETRRQPWLRVALDGFKGDLPLPLRGKGEHLVSAPTEKDVVQFLLRFATSEQISVTEEVAKYAARHVISEYEKQVKSEPDDALETLSEVVIDHMLLIQKKG